MTKRSIVVTGAAGFIGSHVCEHLLAAGHRVYGIDNLSGGYFDNIHLHERMVFDRCDIVAEPAELEAAFKLAKPSVVIHCAAFASEGLSPHVRRHVYTQNLVGSSAVLNAAVNCGTVELFQNLSSIAVYGYRPPPFSEHERPRPADPYGISKYAFEMDLKAAAGMWDFAYVTWRPHNVVGVRQNLFDGYRNAASIFTRCALTGKPLPIFGDGLQTRAFTAIADVAKPIAACCDRPETWNETYNLGSDVVYTVMELAQMVSDAAGVPLEVEHLPERHEAKHAHSKHDKLREAFGDITGHTPLRDEIQRLVDWARAQPMREPAKFSAIEIARGLPPSWA